MVDNFSSGTTPFQLRVGEFPLAVADSRIIQEWLFFIPSWTFGRLESVNNAILLHFAQNKLNSHSISKVSLAKLLKVVVRVLVVVFP